MFTFKIEPDEGDPYEVVATTRDIAKWEKVTKGASLRQLEQEYRATDLYAVAYQAAVRHGLYEGSLKSFEESADLTLKDDDSAEDPTRSAASQGETSP